MLRFHSRLRFCAATALLAALLPLSPAMALPMRDDGNQPCCRDNEHPRWYAAVRGSLVFLSDVDITHPGFTSQTPDGQRFHPGYGFGGAVGYQLFSGVRTELEVMINKSEAKEKGPIVNTLPAGFTEEQRSMAVMLNGYIDLHNPTRFTPYFGAGIGEAHIFNPRYYTNTITSEPSHKLSDWAMAYQFMLGMSYDFKLDHIPGSLDLEYRYFTANDPQDKLTNGLDGPVKFSNDAQNLTLGARLYF